jgi:hypothetical protein
MLAHPFPLNSVSKPEFVELPTVFVINHRKSGSLIALSESTVRDAPVDRLRHPPAASEVGNVG